MFFACDEIGGRINYDGNGYSFCHFFEVDIQKMECQDLILTPELYDKEIERMVKRNANEDAPCRSCSRCRERENVSSKVTFVTINTSKYCNSNCVYCNSYGVEGEGTNPLQSMKMFKQENRFADNCLFDWGGGEPTLNPFFEECVNWVFANGYKQRINTNGILFSEATYKALKGKKASLRLSIDAGSKKVFQRVKGHCYYDEVWENIKKYCEVSDEVYVKYNIFHFNSEQEEADIFLDRCKEAGVKHIYVEAEHYSYGQNINVGPLYFGEKELAFAHYLFDKAKRGFDVEVASGFSDRTKDKSPHIPMQLNSNLDETVLQGDILVETFATVSELIERIGNREILVWGCGNIGGKIFDGLYSRKRLVAMIDSNVKKQGMLYRDSLPILSPEEAYEKYPDAVLILGAAEYADMLRIINRNMWKAWKGNIFYLLEAKWSKFV